MLCADGIQVLLLVNLLVCFVLMVYKFYFWLTC